MQEPAAGGIWRKDKNGTVGFSVVGKMWVILCPLQSWDSIVVWDTFPKHPPPVLFFALLSWGSAGAMAEPSLIIGAGWAKESAVLINWLIELRECCEKGGRGLCVVVRGPLCNCG